MLKVLSGQARGRILKTLPSDDLSIRPMLGRMKKSVFDIIQFNLQGAVFLDLYAGVGSVGIEALSRGAERVVFGELSQKSIDLVKHNLKMLGYENRAEIVKTDIVKNFFLLKGTYDIVFLGPPYKDGAKKALALTYPTLKNIVLNNILKPSSIVISQRHIKEPVAAVAGLENYRIETYGDTVVYFYKLAQG